MQSLEEIGAENPIIITSEGNYTRLQLERLFPDTPTYTDVTPNPNFETCQKAIDFSGGFVVDCAVAVGGGSVMDTAKTVMGALGTGINDIRDLLSVEKDYENRVKAIFVPTTHGTGSEMTMWGTLWDTSKKKKFSISNWNLYPDFAILDPSLTLSLPLDVSLTTVLDALSHSFEAIWNKNANTVSTELAIRAICMILENVEILKEGTDNLKVRRRLLEASNLAGKAFSNTRTAAAHSMSYPLTAHYGIPHGIACSITLLPLLKINGQHIKNELNLILSKLNINEVSDLMQMIRNIPDSVLKFRLSEWGIRFSDLNWLISECYTIERMENNIVDLKKEDVYAVLSDVL